MNGNINFNIHHHKGISQYSYFLNFGGPNVKIDWGKCGIAFGMFPSIRFYDHKIFTIIGTGFQFSYKKWSIVTPMYYIVSPVSKRNIWIVSYGVGYKL
ncbi:MAG: hypothetical protein IT267_04785 [Saprospiraceae bacterium]|nr:hypothetical protein [Saprospiraceae bacterium]